MIPAGAQITLYVTSSSFPEWEPTPNTGKPVGTDTSGDLRIARQGIYHDRDHPSRQCPHRELALDEIRAAAFADANGRLGRLTSYSNSSAESRSLQGFVPISPTFREAKRGAIVDRSRAVTSDVSRTYLQVRAIPGPGWRRLATARS